ncbi:MAG: glycosyltransferase family 39 protein, partial [Candidatus Latescibacteria bacterium]|nr:glycosyltransferase family 39 protein [Candidatus Latescibacterota bacterium]
MSRKQEFGLLGLLLLAGLAIRLSFFIPFQGSDDIGYNEAAYHLASGTYRLEPNLFYLRFGVILPMALSFKLLGVSPLASSLSLLVCSLLMIVLAYAVASHLFDRRVAWLAAILMAVFPLNVFSATEVHADLPMSLYLGLALLFILKADAAEDSRRQIAWGAASGVFWGVAYLTKIPALLTFPAFLVGYRLATKKRLGRILIPLAIGFLAVAAVEMTVYIVYTGDPLYQVHTILRQGHTQAIDRAYPDWRAGLKAVLTVYPDMMFNLL